MAQISLGQIVAERTYEWHTPSGIRSFTACIGQPMRDPRPGGDWMCPVAFRGAPRGLLPTGTQPIYGVDALQALLLAAGYVQQRLAQLQRSRGGDLAWLGKTDLGLPDIIGLVGVRRVFRSPPKRRIVERRVGAS